MNNEKSSIKMSKITCYILLYEEWNCEANPHLPSCPALLWNTAQQKDMVWFLILLRSIFPIVGFFNWGFWVSHVNFDPLKSCYCVKLKSGFWPVGFPIWANFHKIFSAKGKKQNCSFFTFVECAFLKRRAE